MTIAHIFEIPANRQVHLDFKLPVTVPTGKAKIEVIVTPIAAAETQSASEEDWFERGGECPHCAQHRDPVTGNPCYNAETIASFEEVAAMKRGEIPVKWYTSLDDMLKDLDDE